MKKFAFQLLLNSLTLGVLFGQSNSTDQGAISTSDHTFSNKVGIQLGYDQGYLKDDNFSLLNYDVSGFNASLFYETGLFNNKYIFQSRLNFQNAALKNSASDFFKSSSLGGGLELSLLKKLGSLDDKIKTSGSLGIRYSSALDLLDWDNQGSLSFTGVHGFSLLGQLNYSINKNQILFSRISIPFLQILVRPPYNTFDEFIFDNEDKILTLVFTGEPSSFNSYQAFDWTSGYRRKISDRVELDFSYNLKYQKVQKQKTMKHFRHQFNVGLNLNF